MRGHQPWTNGVRSVKQGKAARGDSPTLLAPIVVSAFLYSYGSKTTVPIVYAASQVDILTIRKNVPKSKRLHSEAQINCCVKRCVDCCVMLTAILRKCTDERNPSARLFLSLQWIESGKERRRFWLVEGVGGTLEASDGCVGD